MNFLKRILGIDSTSSQQEELFAGKAGTTGPAISTDDILTYKKEGDVVYGYLNQTVLDTILYNLANKKAQKFPNHCNGESQVKERAITLHDISINKHSVCVFPITDDEYVEKGNLILSVGLNPLDFHKYCRDNRIFDLLSSYGINLYTEYSGFFTNKVKRYEWDYCNFSNTIKDGDLLFTIKLSTKPKEIGTSTLDVKYSLNLLNRDFLDSISYITAITFKDWLVDDHTMVDKGDDIIEVTEFTSSPKFSTTIKAPIKGVLIKKYRKLYDKLITGDSLFTIIGEDNNEHTI